MQQCTLVDNGRTVVVADHDDAAMATADVVVEPGPGAGSWVAGTRPASPPRPTTSRWSRRAGCAPRRSGWT
ncbi:hypothetical protein DV701_13715 [Ornithinimicrobium avium]|uniref:Uncharacterized protein n=1 Tax=Ornithinimicrobium avium TaxID=2283195 RepID=A0A345NPT0_9MICO|nr:hypothetical protein DV701_13715 [Ornithinimicrobium avium]